VITGFNTDVEFDGVTYHIQTEDKGLSTPFILSLVYDRGTILASKRAPYDDLLKGGLDEKALAERLNKQHKTICAAVRKGRINELKSRNENSHKAGAKPTKKQKRAETAAPSPELAVAGASRSGLFEDEPPIPMPKAVPAFPPPALPDTEPVIDDAAIFELPHDVLVDVVEVVSDLAGTERPDNARLGIEFVGSSDFRAGSECTVSVMVSRGGQRKLVSGAEIMVKVLGSSFRPLIFHSLTDRNGLATVVVRLPNFSSGRASLMVRAMSQGEEVEIRRAIAYN
jgi:hypothetical protein